MHRTWSTACFLLLTILLHSCATASPPPQPTQSSLFIYRFEPPAFIEFAKDWQPIQEIPFPIPAHCGLLDVFPAPVGKYLLVELSCPNGQTVLFLDTVAGSITQPVTDSDSHFLAWKPDGQSVYLRVDSLGSPRTLRLGAEQKHETVPITEFTYDLAANPVNSDFTFTFSRGMGKGSELWLAQRDGNVVEQLYADLGHYISFARYSPTGEYIAFIKIPDSATPFTVGELWVIDAAGSNARKLADVDAGHGYAANWSPDGTKIAFVQRENPQDEKADQSTESLISNIYTMDVQSGAKTPITQLTNGRAETPHWSPEGNTLSFHIVIDGRMTVFTADILTGESRALLTETACCPAWMRK